MQEKGRKILILEDDIDTLTLIYTTLLPMDFVLEATLEVDELKLRIERFRPDLLLIGSTMAGESQIDLLEKVNQQYDMQVMVMGDINAIAIPLYKRLFIADFLLHPFQPSQLLIKINNLLPVE